LSRKERDERERRERAEKMNEREMRGRVVLHGGRLIER
jgi:hypothetical protein